MSILKVAQLGHPILRMVSRPVTAEELSSGAFQDFCDDLLETMEEYDGTGLAAPQVHMLLRVVVLSLGDRQPEFFINPSITVLSDTLAGTMEGCLSVQGMRARVERPDRIKIEALDRHGKPKAYELEGFPAVVVQHECDHLDGVLYVDRCETRTLAFMPEYRRHGPLDEWFEEEAREQAGLNDDDLEEELEEDTEMPETEEVKRLSLDEDAETHHVGTT